jgi:hypothetical protein
MTFQLVFISHLRNPRLMFVSFPIHIHIIPLLFLCLQKCADGIEALNGIVFGHRSWHFWSWQGFWSEKMLISKMFAKTCCQLLKDSPSSPLLIFDNSLRFQSPPLVVHTSNSKLIELPARNKFQSLMTQATFVRFVTQNFS